MMYLMTYLFLYISLMYTSGVCLCVYGRFQVRCQVGLFVVHYPCCCSNHVQS